jgi:hypothetical protein
VRGLFGMRVSGRARRTQEPIGPRPAITEIVTIQVIGDTGNGDGTAMTTSTGSTMTAGCTVVGTGATGTTKARPLTGSAEVACHSSRTAKPNWEYSGHATSAVGQSPQGVLSMKGGPACHRRLAPALSY